MPGFADRDGRPDDAVVDTGAGSAPRLASPWQAVMLLGLIGTLPAHASAAPIRLARPVAALAGDVAGIVRREEDRPREICAEHGLRYDFAADPIGMSWYDGRIAFAARRSAHPGFSFTPVPYATVSVLFDPATGAADRLVVTRRLWADPPD